MEYLVPLLILAGVALVVVVLVRWLGRGARSAARSGGRGAAQDTAVAAREASARMDQQTHREVYRLIAQGKVGEAAATYRRHTDRGPLESVWDIHALASHPQPWAPAAQAPQSPDDVTHPSAEVGEDAAHQDGPQSPETDGAEGESAPAGQPAVEESGLTDLTIPDEWSEQGPAQDPAFELEVVREDSTVRVSSADLPPWLRDQLTAMVRDGRLEPAAEELANHSVLTPDEALQFLQIMGRDRRGELGG